MYWSVFTSNTICIWSSVVFLTRYIFEKCKFAWISLISLFMLRSRRSTSASRTKLTNPGTLSPLWTLAPRCLLVQVKVFIWIKIALLSSYILDCRHIVSKSAPRTLYVSSSQFRCVPIFSYFPVFYPRQLPSVRAPPIIPILKLCIVFYSPHVLLDTQRAFHPS